MKNSILNKMANNDFLFKLLERFYQNFNFLKNLEFYKNRDNEKIFHFFPYLKFKDLSTNELEVEFLFDLVIFK